MIKFKDKIFKKKSYYEISIPNEFKVKVKTESKVTKGSIIAELIPDISTINVGSKDKLVVKVGDYISAESVLSEKKFFFRKKKIKSNLNGVVKEITENSILIEKKTLLTDDKTSQITSPFNAVVKRINSNRVVLEFESTQLGLIDAKGDTAIGTVNYISQKELSFQKYKLQSYEGSIIVTDFMDSKIYPKLSAMGIVGIVTNSIDFELFNDIVTLAVPVGVISGFGLLKEDKSLVEWFESVKGHTAILDGRYNKLIFPEYDNDKN